MESHPHRIGPVARDLGISLRTIRLYEEKGLISPKRVGTSRKFSDTDVAKLKRIRELVTYGISLEEARAFFRMMHTERLAFLRERRDAMAIQIRDTHAAFKLLDAEVEGHGR